MNLSEHVHEVRVPFQSVIGKGGTVTRTVNLWLIDSEKICGLWPDGILMLKFRRDLKIMFKGESR